MAKKIFNKSKFQNTVQKRERFKLGQVWVETVIYTLVAFALIGLALSFAKPKIEEIQDQAIIEQTIDVMENINSIMFSIVQGGSGNKREVSLGIKKGEFRINGVDDTLVFEMESSYTYSQPGENISFGNVIVHTKTIGNLNIVSLTSSSAGNYNITYKDKDEVKSISRASVPYKLFIANKGKTGNKTIIDFEII